MDLILFLILLFCILDELQNQYEITDYNDQIDQSSHNDSNEKQNNFFMKF